MVLPLADGGEINVSSPLYEDQHAVFSSMPWWADVTTAEPTLAKDPFPMPTIVAEEEEEEEEEEDPLNT